MNTPTTCSSTPDVAGSPSSGRWPAVDKLGADSSGAKSAALAVAAFSAVGAKRQGKAAAAFSEAAAAAARQGDGAAVAGVHGAGAGAAATNCDGEQIAGSPRERALRAVSRLRKGGTGLDAAKSAPSSPAPQTRAQEAETDGGGAEQQGMKRYVNLMQRAVRKTAALGSLPRTAASTRPTPKEAWPASGTSSASTGTAKFLMDFAAHNKGYGALPPATAPTPPTCKVPRIPDRASSALPPRRRAMTRPPVPTQRSFGERCNTATQASVQTACQVFWSFDASDTGVITRDEYLLRLSDPPTADRLRFLRRANMEARFRQSANPVSLEDFLWMIWPSAPESDMRLILRWAHLHKARSAVLRPNFRGTELELRTVWELLGGDPRGEALEVSALVRSQILTAAEARRLICGADPNNTKINMETYRNTFHQYLKSLYVTSETLKRIKAEEESSMAQHLEMNLALSFSKKSN